MTMDPPYDALLLVAFGGPEGPEEVMPFLQRVTAGRGVPPERLEEVAEHYYHFGGVSPINAQMRHLQERIRQHLNREGPPLPVYWGNRNWHPLLEDTLSAMARDGVRRALAFVVSPYSSYSSCRQYLENLEAARKAVGPEAPIVHKIRPFFNHPRFIAAQVDQVCRNVPPGELSDPQTMLLFTAHSIPLAMARGCAYQEQLQEAARLVVEALGGNLRWQLAYQSRSGPPSQPWLEPDVNDVLAALAAEGSVRRVLTIPIGFMSDHLEVLYDLDVEAAQTASRSGLLWRRLPTVGAHPEIVQMVRELVLERWEPPGAVRTVGRLPARPHHCPPDCCPRQAPLS